MPDPIAWLNGTLVPFAEARLPVWDLGIVQGATVTDMIRTFRLRPFRLEQHLNRLRRSLAEVGFGISQSDDDLETIVNRLIEANAIPDEPLLDLGVVIFVTGGPQAMYAQGLQESDDPTICVHTFPLAFDRWAAKYEEGQSLVIPEIAQVPAGILNPQIKYRSRLHWYLADRAARSKVPGASALLLDLDGFITETNSGNVAIVEGDRIVAPSVGKVLEGVSLEWIFELAGSLGLHCRREDIDVERLTAADEVFVTSTTYCLLPVTRVDGVDVGDGRPGRVARRLLSAWSSCVGVDIVRQAESGGKGQQV
ncbi:Branched-chain-amino-acid aminotransferase [Maioricimonas rarisocia]|uniref:branched-chain-amino-acid transaminase n=1 Tax=Maioricimonas rarisocia TaxID=2528026 RepID=A0A517Z8L6_9PLAN|nr:aminotransferase class IV [Maioricimonas rarisocia]QDU38828.1 Branched-chain-amino-acid aminotransferase [Maioricimonas rarisocia]